jgi:hypothetical protein
LGRIAASTGDEAFSRVTTVERAMTKPSEVGHINWEPSLSFNPTSLDQFATHGIPIPTYGNYGGPGYTAGTLGGTTPPPPNPNPPPVDALDQLFYAHDFALQQAQANQDPQAAVAASVELVLKMDQLTLIEPSAPNYDPAAQLYEGLATLAVTSQLIAPAWQFIDPSTQAMIETATQDAVTNFEEGLAAIPGEAGSLHGAFHVFEHQFAQSLPFDLFF